MTQTRFRFTRQQAEEILRLREEGAPTREIVERFGHRNSIYRLFRGETTPRGGNRQRSLDEQERELIVRRWEDGVAAGAIAKDINRSDDFVKRVLRDAGYVVTRRPYRAKPGDRVKHRAGYLLLHVAEDDPMASMATGTGLVLEHRLVMARSIGRPLWSWETVHHVNGQRRDNRLENLQLRSSRHGPGVVHRCRACGSSDIESVQIADA